MQGAMSARMARPLWGRAVGGSQSETRQAWSRNGPGEGARAGLGRVRLRDGRKSVHCGWKGRRDRRGGRGLEERENGSRVTLRPPALGTAGQWPQTQTASLGREGGVISGVQLDLGGLRGRGVKKGKAIRLCFLKVPRQNKQKRLCFKVEAAETGSDPSCARGAPRTGQGPGGGERSQTSQEPADRGARLAVTATGG